MEVYPAWQTFTFCELERSTMFNGKTHYLDWAIFNSYVKLLEGYYGFNDLTMIKHSWDRDITR